MPTHSGAVRHEIASRKNVLLRVRYYYERPCPASLLWAFLLHLIVSVTPTQAQDCGIADVITYPVDQRTFTLAQDFGIPSYRHEGRYHTGEDWYGGRGTSVLQPVRAAAAGRVTYAYSLAWGRDAGVVIVEHTFPDERVAYTVYGHLQSTATTPMPQVFDCVTIGQVLGSVADVRPAPHLHFEVRTRNGNDPGAGYTVQHPTTLGYREPKKFITNQQAQLDPAYLWRVNTTEERGPLSAPLLLNDNSMLYLDGGTTLRRATQDGRVLWRVRLDKPAVAITGYQGASLLTFADGTMQIVDPNAGALGSSWRVPLQFSGAPILIDVLDWLLFPTQTGALVAIDETRRNIVWQLDDIPPVQRYHITGGRTNVVLGLITQQPDTNVTEAISISGSGALIDRVQLRESGSFATSTDGALLAYTLGGLWRVGVDASWLLHMPDAPGGGDSSAVLVTSVLDPAAELPTTQQRTLLFDGETLHAYDAGGDVLWRAGLPDVSGMVQLAQYNAVTLLTSAGGHITAINPSGIVCGRLRVFGRDDARVWHDLGSDGSLRVAIADQIIGVDWAAFTARCT